MTLPFATPQDPNNHQSAQYPQPMGYQQAMAPTLSPGIQPVPGAPMYRFDGGAASWFFVQLIGVIITIFTLGLCYPWAVVMTYQWKASHTYLFGHRLKFTGSAMGLFGHWIKWWFLTFITLGIYSFWVYPRMTKWTVEHQTFEQPQVAFA